MPKVLICSSTLVHLRNFHLPYLEYFEKLGWDIHIAAPQTEPIPFASVMHEIPMAKNVLSPKNITAVLKLRRVLLKNDFTLVMTHAALAGIVGRAGVLLSRGKKARVIHTSHGYFFWNGCGLLRKILYYTPERLLRRVTDCIVTMNEEDFAAARKLVRKGGLAVKVPGMGVDGSRFFPACDARKATARQTLGIENDVFVCVCAAEFSKRKNHAELLRAFAAAVKSVPKALLLMCGDGKLRDVIASQAAVLGLGDSVRFLGWRDRMEEVYAACDLAVSTSVSEGLPFNILEAQLCALPVAASRIRGHTDLVENGVTGFLYEPGDTDELSEIIARLHQDRTLGKTIGTSARESAQRFTLDKAFAANTAVYKKMIDGK
jgi:glycosyltransferase EpsD